MQAEALTPVLHVADAQVAVAWYRRLGFVVEYEWSSGPAFREASAVVRRGDLALILSNRDPSVGADSLLYLRVADLTQIANEFKVSAASAFGGQQVELHDPDGNRIRVVAIAVELSEGRSIGPY